MNGQRQGCHALNAIRELTLCRHLQRTLCQCTPGVHTGLCLQGGFLEHPYLTDL